MMALSFMVLSIVILFGNRLGRNQFYAKVRE